MEIYSYFENLYSNCDDTIVCINKAADVVFATESAYTLFNTERSSFSHISYVLPMRDCYTLQDIIKTSKRVSFVSRNAIDGNLYKFTVIPYPIKDDQYFLISLTPVADKNGKSEKDVFIDTVLKIAEKELLQCTASIVAASKKLSDDDFTQVTKSVRKIRKSFDSFYTVMCDAESEEKSRAIDLNRYFYFFIEAFYKYADSFKTDIRFTPSALTANICISQQTLDILCCNIIATVIKNTNKSTPAVSITVEKSADRCVILFADNDTLSNYAENECNLLSLALIEKLTKRSGGSMFTTDNAHGGTTIAISFPQYESEDTLYAPEQYDLESMLSTFSIMLSDI